MPQNRHKSIRTNLEGRGDQGMIREWESLKLLQNKKNIFCRSWFCWQTLPFVTILYCLRDKNEVKKWDTLERWHLLRLLGASRVFCFRKYKLLSWLWHYLQLWGLVWRDSYLHQVYRYLAAYLQYMAQISPGIKPVKYELTFSSTSRNFWKQTR